MTYFFIGEDMKKVAINASGGGSDSGVKGNGIIEKELTLQIANRIKSQLENAGVEVLMLRSGDETISYDDRIKKLKNAFPNPKDVIVLSNTLNSGGSSGIEVIYPLKNSNILPNSLEESLSYFNDADSFQYRWPTDTSKDFYYITRNTPDYETIIVRYGYVDNANDASILKNNYIEMADAVADAVLDYIGVVGEDDYVVKAGDTLYALANKWGTTVNEIKTLNKLSSNSLSIGQTLKVPDNKPSSQPPQSVMTYKVQSGDTLYSIARKFGINVEKLKDINNLKSNLISIGQILNVANEKTYTVKKGDTLYAIAKQFNTTVDKLKDINNLKTNTLSIGQTIRLP